MPPRTRRTDPALPLVRLVRALRAPRSLGVSPAPDRDASRHLSTRSPPSCAASSTLTHPPRPRGSEHVHDNDLLSRTIDVQGFSHRGRDQFMHAHHDMPRKPLYASECCSCNTMRGEDTSTPNAAQASWNGDCQAVQTNSTDGIDYAIGTMVRALRAPCKCSLPFVAAASSPETRHESEQTE